MTACPVCDSSATINANRFTLSASRAAQQFVLAESDATRHKQLSDHIRTLWSRDECEMAECTECGLGFANPFVAGDAQFYNLAAHAEYPTNKWEYSITASALGKLDTSDRRAIEIGSGYGNFLKCISPRYFQPQSLLAIEYNQAAGEQLIKNGFRVEAHDIRSDQFLAFKNAFDFVFMFQVLEHMDELNALADRLRYITKEQAHIFVAVPNPSRIRFNECNGSLIDAPPNHISLWTRRAFEKFAAKLGGEVINFRNEPMSWIRFIKQDIVYSHMQRATKQGSLANWIRSKPRTLFRRMTEAILAALWIPSRISYWIRATSTKESLGGSIWVHIRKAI